MSAKKGSTEMSSLGVKRALRKVDTEFNSVARIVFGTARRAGVAVSGFEKSTAEDDYVRQLIKLQQHSKKRGGSLGKLALNVAKVLSPPAVFTSPPPSRSCAKLIAPLDLPIRGATEDKKTTKTSTTGPKFELRVPGSIEKQSTMQRPTVQPIKPASVSSVEPLNIVRSVPKATQESPPTEQHVPKAQSKTEFSPTPRVKVAAKKSGLDLASSVQAKEGDNESPSSPPPVVASATDWIEQRERELEAIRQRERDDEEQALKLERQEKLRVATAAWVNSRGELVDRATVARLGASQKHFKMIEKVFYAPDWEAALDVLSDVELSKSMQPAVTLATLRAAQEASSLVAEAVVTAAESAGFVATDAKIRILSQRFRHQEIQDLLKEIPAERLRTLRRNTLATFIRSSTMTGWQNGLEVLASMKKYCNDPFCYLELAYAVALRRSTGTRYERFKAAQLVERSLRERMGELGKLHATKIAETYSRLGRSGSAARIIKDFRSKGELDEALLRAMLAGGPDCKVDEVDREMLDEGFDVHHPSYAISKAYALLGADRLEDARTVFSRLLRSTEFHWTRQCLELAVELLRALPEEQELLETALGGISAINDRLSTKHRSVLYPVLAKLERYTDLVDLHDRFPLDTPQAMSQIAVEALNKGLIACSREPIATVSSDAVDANQVADEVEHMQLPSTERMLELAKDRNWEEALQLLGRVHFSDSIPQEQMASLTLIHNCALSAAIDVPSVVAQVSAAMDSHGIPKNSTTHNTIMSSFARAPDRWSSALQEFASMPTDRKDPSSYSVVLALLAKRALWVEAVTTVQDLQREQRKAPSPVVYSLLIQAVHKNSWSCSLAALQEMHRAHGSEHIKELAVTRVVRSLEAAGKISEVALVSELMKSKKKKSKRKQ